MKVIGLTVQTYKDELYALLKKWEGYKRAAYADGNGIPNINRKGGRFF